MADKLTRAQAIANLIDFLSDPDITLAFDGKYACSEETIGILDKMYHQITKPRVQTESKSAIENRQILNDILVSATELPDDIEDRKEDAFTAKDFGESFGYTSSKASSILKLGCSDGKLGRRQNKNGVFEYYVI